MEIRPGVISVIVPIYNVEACLRLCIESIQNQTYSNLEIILVDDGSPDNSGKICDEYAAKDPRIVVLHNKNGGPAAARNAGIEAATGEYISFCDGDDTMVDTMLEELLQNLLSTQSDVSVCGRRIVYGEHPLSSKGLPVSDLVIFTQPTISQYVMHTKFHSAAPWGRLYRHSFLGDLRFDTSHLCFEDYVFSVKLSLKAQKVCYTRRPLYNYFQRPGSAMHGIYYPKHEHALRVQEEVLALAETSPWPKALLPSAQAGCLFQSLLVAQKIACTTPFPGAAAKRFSRQIRRLSTGKCLALLPLKARLLSLLAGYLPGLHRFFHRRKYCK